MRFWRLRRVANSENGKSIEVLRLLIVRSAALWILWNCRGCNCVIVLLVLGSLALPESFPYSCEWWQAAWQSHAAVCSNGYKSMVLVVSRLF